MIKQALHTGPRLSRGERVFSVFNAVLLFVLCLIMLYPVLFVLGRSVTSDAERALHPLRLIPHAFDWSGYKFIFFSGSNIINSYAITIARTLIGTFINLVVSCLLAYPISKREYPARKVLTTLIVFTMWFNGGLIPTYLLNKDLGLINSFWVYILPGAVNTYNMIILRNFFMEIPATLEESAKLDGANDFKIFLRIYLPLSYAALATIGLFYAVWHWNSWFDSMLYMNKKEMWTLQYTLRQLINSANVIDISTVGTSADTIPPADTIRMSTIIVAIVPILCVYPFLQKYFVKGLLVGAIKG